MKLKATLAPLQFCPILLHWILQHSGINGNALANQLNRLTVVQAPLTHWPRPSESGPGQFLCAIMKECCNALRLDRKLYFDPHPGLSMQEAHAPQRCSSTNILVTLARLYLYNSVTIFRVPTVLNFMPTSPVASFPARLLCSEVSFRSLPRCWYLAGLACS